MKAARVLPILPAPQAQPKRKRTLALEYDAELEQPLAKLEYFETPAAGAIAGAPPEIVQANPATDLLIDRNYQRSITASDRRQLERMIANWDWAKFKVPNGFRTLYGRIRLTDGQKTSLACLYLGIKSIPVCVQPYDPDNHLSREADAFIGINRDRRAVPTHELFAARLMRGDPQERRLAELLREHHVNPVTAAGRKERDFKPLDCTCITTFLALFKMSGEEYVTKILRIIELVKYKPIRKEHIAALERVCDAIGVTKVDERRLANAILSIIDKYAVLEAREMKYKSNRDSYKIGHALAEIYLKRYRARAKALNANEQ